LDPWTGQPGSGAEGDAGTDPTMTRQVLQSEGRKLPQHMLQLMALIEKEGPAFAQRSLITLTEGEWWTQAAG